MLTLEHQIIAASPSGTKKNHKGWLRVGLVLVLLIAGLELCFRCAGIGEDEVLQSDPLLGYSLSPNYNVTWRREGHSRLRLNQFGMQDDQRNLEQKENTRRVAVLGDSFVEAMQVQRPANFCSRIEKQLNSKHTNQFEILNFGVQGYSTGMSLLQFQNKVKHFHPDLVVLCMRPEEYALCELHSKIQDVRATQFGYPAILVKNGHLNFDFTAMRQYEKTFHAKWFESTTWLRRDCRTWVVLYPAIRNVLHYRPWTKHDSEQPAQIEQKSVSQYQQILVHKILESFENSCRSQHCQIMVVRLPHPYFKNEAESQDLRSCCAQLHIPYVDLETKTIANFPNTFHTLFQNGNGHFNNLGHEFIAQQLAPVIERAALPY